MEHFVPRSNTLQPKLPNEVPPRYTVPDVTLMCESDDSLIWKTGEDNIFVKKKMIQANNIRPKECSPLYKQENIKNNQGTFDQSLQHKNFHSPSSNAFKFINKDVYNPEHYMSPKPMKPALAIIEEIPFHGNYELEKYSNNSKKVFSKNYMQQAVEKQIVNAPKDISAVPHRISKEKTDYKRSEMLSQEYHSPPRQQAENIDFSHNAHILKLIEGQNQQILYLHKVLEKVLGDSNQSPFECNTGKHCECCKKKSDTGSRETAVQTFFSDDKTETKSVATNTDISWNILSPPQNICANKNDLNYKQIEFNNIQNSNFPLNHGIETQDEDEKFPFESGKKEMSLNLKNLDLKTICDPSSPEHTLHLNVPDYQDDACTIKQSLINTSPTQYLKHGDKDAELSAHDSPLAGESALLYNERLRQNELRIGNELLVENKQEDNDGVTLYNNVMISIKQILQKTKGKEKDLEVNRWQLKGNGDPVNPIVNESQQNFYPLTQLQLQNQLGISFLEPLTSGEKHKVSALLDKFYLVDSVQHGASLSNLEIVNRPEQEKQVRLNSVSDAHLVAIAQRFPDAMNRAKNIKNKTDVQKTERSENDFSFATQQFLGKYELDK